MTTAPQPALAESPASTVVAGAIYGLSSAVLYTVANTFLRSATGCDPIWVSTVKAVPTVLLVGPWLLVRYSRRERILPSRGVLIALLLAALAGQLGGNVLFQIALGIVGIAMTVPLTLGTIIVAGALLGRIFLNEAVTLRMLGALAMLIAAFVLLGLGAPQAYGSVAGNHASGAAAWWFVATGVGTAMLAGFAYAVLGVVIRYGVTGRASLSTTMFIVGSVGVVSLGAISLQRLGWTGMWGTSQQDFALMLLAGVCNTIAFLALTKALQLTTLTFVNALNATQATMAAVAGVLFFGEARSPELVWGVALTILGLLLMQESGERRSDG